MPKHCSSQIEAKSLNDRIAAIRAKANEIGFNQPECTSSPTTMVYPFHSSPTTMVYPFHSSPTTMVYPFHSSPN
ncbi:hypothetical protein [[Scytonema hofmanni] UTEX B 1581]|uniref:hypothetical protein n=1 Tax=[Scytonema hofmanni] UTEX B 1581 TaxID=379535 RepID=UPI001183EBA6|nr:hypothetical protein [[Scytonema hofmanni] UTEX B 1581]